MKKWMLFGVLMASLLARTGWAFPSWMGVYGDVQRHNGQNPGTFTILMNQNYTGLQAYLGLQVGNGAWSTRAMTFAGTKDGNSVWTLIPDAPFTAGETVKFYFMGGDSSSATLWDSNNGQNYSFVATEPPLSFGPAASIAANYPFADLDACAASGIGFLGLQGDQTAYGVRPSVSAGWSLSTLFNSVSNRFGDVVVAANSNVALLVSSFNNTLVVHRLSVSAGGSSLLNTVAVPVDMGSFNNIAEISAAAWGQQNFVIALAVGSSGFNPLGFTLRSTDNGQTWSTPTNSFGAEYGCGPVLLGATAQGPVLVHKDIYHRADYLKVKKSTDGLTWTSTTLTNALGGGSVGRPALLATKDQIMVTLDPDNSLSTYVWREVNGTFVKSSFNRGFSSYGRPALCELPDGRVGYFRQNTNGAVVFSLSTDRGLTWTAGGIAPLPATGYLSFLKAFPVGNTVNLLWHQWVTNEVTLGHVQTARITGPQLQWLGGTYVSPGTNILANGGDGAWMHSQSWPIGAAVSVEVVYSQDGWNWQRAAMRKGEVRGNNDTWYYDFGSHPADTSFRVALVGKDGAGREVWDNNGGRDYAFSFAAEPQRPTLQWAGNLTVWPPNGQAGTNNDIWVNCETWPAGAAKGGVILYALARDGYGYDSLRSVDMILNGQAGNNDRWHVNLGKFAAAEVINFTVTMEGSSNAVQAGQSAIRINGSAGDRVQWAGNVRTETYPMVECGRGGCITNQGVRVVAESWPQGAGVLGQVVYSRDHGATWETGNMSRSVAGNNNRWSLELGRTVSLKYAIMIRDWTNRDTWLNNGGRDYTY